MADQKDTIDTFFDDPSEALGTAQCLASTEWEMDFISQQIARYNRFGDMMLLSQKQADIIRRIGRLGQ